MNTDYLNTHQVAELFNVSGQTIKNYADSFADFLSPTATPGRGRRRSFVGSDLKVFALLVDYHRRGHTYEDARLSLAAGERGDIPEPNQQITITPAQMVRLQDEIDGLRQQVKNLESERDESRGQNKLLRELLGEKEREIRDLLRGG